MTNHATRSSRVRKISIIGAGQFGLHLGIALRRAGHDVTIVTDRSADDVRNGRVMSSQILYGPTLARQDELGMNLWNGRGGVATDASLSVTDGAGTELLGFRQPAAGGVFGQSVDQRVSIPAWMEQFERSGGRLVVCEVDVDDAEELSAQADLTVVAAGKGALGRLFETDEVRTVHEKPQRHVAMFYAHGMTPDALGATTSRFVQVAGVGEYVTFPGLTHSGPCDILLFESRFGSPMHDLIKDARTGDEVLGAGRAILETFIPWEAQRCTGLSLTDSGAWLAGAVPGIVRRPLAHLPSGRMVMGGGDVVVLNDPLVGQGANNAASHAEVVSRAILDHGDGPFDEDFVERTFADHWERARWRYGFTNLVLHPPAHLPEVLVGLQQSDELRTRFLAGFGDPSSMGDWLFDADRARDAIRGSVREGVLA